MVPGPGEALSETGSHYVGGTLEHGVAASVFTTPDGQRLPAAPAVLAGARTA